MATSRCCVCGDGPSLSAAPQRLVEPAFLIQASSRSNSNSKSPQICTQGMEKLSPRWLQGCELVHAPSQNVGVGACDQVLTPRNHNYVAKNNSVCANMCKYYIYIYIYILIHNIDLVTYIYIFHVHIHKLLHLHIHTMHRHVHIHIYIYTYIHIYIYTYIHIYTYTHIHVYLYLYSYMVYMCIFLPVLAMLHTFVLHIFERRGFGNLLNGHCSDTQAAKANQKHQSIIFSFLP